MRFDPERPGAYCHIHNAHNDALVKRIKNLIYLGMMKQRDILEYGGRRDRGRQNNHRYIDEATFDLEMEEHKRKYVYNAALSTFVFFVTIN